MYMHQNSEERMFTTNCKAVFGFMVVAICVVLVLGTVHAQPDSPIIEWIDCPATFISFSRTHSAKISCGQLRVPEDRTTPAGSLVRLFVAVIAALENRPLPPLLYLAGGPGDAASSEIASWLAAGLHQPQDIIFVDLRGSGRSEPSLNCPKYDERFDSDRLIMCRDRLLSEGINLAAYSSDAITSDIVDLITAMQLRSVNIYGYSYGTRLAWRVAEQLPERIKVLVLDGAYLPGESAIEAVAPNTQRSLQRVFADCDADPLCNSAYPRLQAEFEQAVADLNAAPIEIDGFLPSAVLRLDGTGFLRLLREMLADSKRLPYIPAFITAVAEGDHTMFARLDELRYEEDIGDGDAHSEGLYMSALCAEEMAATSLQKIRTAADSLSSIYAPLARSALELLDDCAVWNGKLVADDLTLDSYLNVPTLFLSGRYDPIAPVHGLSAHSTQGWSYEDPQLGHGVLLSSKCAQNVMLAFLSDPAIEPRHDCLLDQEPLEFYLRQDN